MPWTKPVDQRLAFVRRRLAGESMTALCAAYGISRPTGYKWVKRFEEGGKADLVDRSRAPREPRATSPETVEAILALREEFGWGPKKLRKLLVTRYPKLQPPACSTIAEILKRRGLVDEERSRRRRRAGARDRAQSKPELAESHAPNDVWCVDFKGDFRLGNRERCYPLTITDHFTRYVIACVAFSSTRLRGVQRVLSQAFREHGLPKNMRSDNGSPFGGEGVLGYSYLSVWLLRHGVRPEHIAPGRPDQNGRHERMHRTLKADTAKPPEKTLRQQQRVFGEWRTAFNEVRPHEGIQLATPASLYEKSPRKLGRPRSPSYPGHHEVKRIQNKGHFHWRGTDVFVGAAFRGEPVGLEEVGEELWLVSYGETPLGVLDTRLIGQTPWLKISSLDRWRPETPEEPRGRGRRPGR